MTVNETIVLRGHEYATPRTESVEIINQGVLCGSGGGGGGGVTNGNLNGFTAGTEF